MFNGLVSHQEPSKHLTYRVLFALTLLTVYAMTYHILSIPFQISEKKYMHIKFAECCPARWTICLLTCKRQNIKRELGIVIANIFWIFRALYMLSEPSWYTLCLPFCAPTTRFRDNPNSLSDQILGQVTNDGQSSKVEATNAQ